MSFTPPLVCPARASTQGWSPSSRSRAFHDTWETFSIEEDRIINADQTVVILGRVKAKGEASGAALETSVAYVHILRERKLARTQVFFTTMPPWKLRGSDQTDSP